MQPSRDLSRLVEIMAALRTPGTGCPWDLDQTFATIAPYTIEEAFEVADAIARGDMVDLKDELGDLLLQVVFHAQIAEEKGVFALPDVIEAINRKLIRRHPHVFGDARDLTPGEVKRLWDQIKAQEKAERRDARRAAGQPDEIEGLLDDIPAALPALTRADKLTRKAATVGFDWSDTKDVLAKIREELAETEAALASGDRTAMADEIGDLLFACANLARHAGIDPEGALAGTNAKFTRRFQHIETSLARDEIALADASLDQMEAHWNEAKRQEREALPT